MKGYVLRRLAEQASVIIARYTGGASFQELGEEFACSWQTVRRFLIANDVPLRTATWKLKLAPYEAEVCAAYSRGESISALAQRYGVQEVTVRRFLDAKLPRGSLDSEPVADPD